MFALITLLWILCAPITVTSLSACDDIDISFIIDQNTIEYNLDGLITFIDSIIEHGSSEHSAISAYVYGNGINYYQDFNLLQVKLLDTYGKHRNEKSIRMKTHLMNVFNRLNISDESNADMINISLEEAFTDAALQQQPARKNHKRQRFNTIKYEKHKIGNQDGNNRYFVFDHFNKLLTDTSHICNIINHVDDNEHESIHFIMGQEFRGIRATFNELCPHSGKYLFNNDLFWYLDSLDQDDVDETNENEDSASDEDEYKEYSESDEDDSEEDQFYDGKYEDQSNYYQGQLLTMESIYHITCPTQMLHPQYNGDLHLSPHTQWVDEDTIIKCDLHYNTVHHADENYLTHELDPTTSYIIVKDIYHDHNTFKINDFLIAEPEMYDSIQRIGCKEPIYKIIDIQHVKQIDEQSNILRLHVTLPNSPMDYIRASNIEMVEAETHPHANGKRQKNKPPTPAPIVIGHSRRLLGPPSVDGPPVLKKSPKLKKTVTFGKIYRHKYVPHNSFSDESFETDEDIPLIWKPKQSMLSTLRQKSVDIMRAVRRKFSKKIQTFSDEQPVILKGTKSLATLELEKAKVLKHPSHSMLESLERTEIRAVEDGLEVVYSKGRTYAEALKNGEKIPGIDLQQDGDVEWSATEETAIENAGKEDSKKGFFYKKTLWSEKFSWPKTPVAGEKVFSSGTDIQLLPFVKLTTTAEGKLTYETYLDIKIVFQGRFQWTKLFTPGVDSNINIRIQIVGTLEAFAKFTFNAKAQFEIKFSFPIEIGTYILMAGPVPIIIKPYFLINAGIISEALSVDVTAELKYTEAILVGYAYGGTQATKTKWTWGKGKSGFPKLTRTKYMAVPDVESEEDLLDPENKEHKGFFFDRQMSDKEHMEKDFNAAIYSDEGDKCNFKVGITVYLEPRFGIQLYGAIGLEAGLRVDIPILMKAHIKDGATKCETDKKAVCVDKTVKKLKAAPEVALVLHGVIAVKLRMPAFIWGLKEFFVIKKIAKGIFEDFAALKQDIKDQFTDKSATVPALLTTFKTTYDKMDKARLKMKGSGKKKEAIDDFTDAIHDLAKEIVKAKQSGDKWVKKWAGKIEKRETQIKKLIKRLGKIAENPFKIDEKEKVWKPKFATIPLYLPTSPKCWEMPEWISKLVINACCSSKAYEDIFSDWYDGYDEYYIGNEYDNEYDNVYDNEYDNEYDNVYDNEYDNQFSGAQNMKHNYLNSAPIYEPKPMTGLILLDIFAVFIAFVCMASCICLACGAFVAYKYGEFSKKEVQYNQLDQNDDQI